MARIKTTSLILVVGLNLIISLQLNSLAKEITVGKGSHYTSITKALESSSDGDVIIVKEGIYNENIIINKMVKLFGENEPVIEGSYRGDVVKIEADKVIFKGFTVRKSGTDLLQDESGIKVLNSQGVIIEDNKLEDVLIGIYLYSSPGNIVKDNSSSGRADSTTQETNGNGVHLWKSPNNTIEGNQIRKHRDGIYVEFSPGNVIRGNLCRGNVRYGLHYMYSDENIFDGNTFEGNGTGSALMYSKNIILRKNTFKDNLGLNGIGILLKSLSDSTVEENLIADNTVGIFMDDANRNIFTRNNFLRNGWAIDLFSSSTDNILYANNFSDNNYQVMTDTERSINQFFKDSKGNYWSDYKGYNGYDLNGDGIGDIPYKPVKLLSYLVKRYPDLTVFIDSPGFQALEFAERVLPVLNPVNLEDPYPFMNPILFQADSK